MTKWLIKLKGERFDLEDLLQLLKSSELMIVEEDGVFYLQSSEFDSLTSADEVRERGKALLRLVNSVAKFDRDNYQDVAENGITQVAEDGIRQQYVFVEGIASIRAKVSANVTVVAADGNERIDPQPSRLESLVEIAQKWDAVADALNFYRDDTWISLYKVYEIIGDDIGSQHYIIRNKWANKPDISRFTLTAQSRAALGDSARHASEKYKPPPTPMSFSEAKTLIKNIFSQWINSKK